MNLRKLFFISFAALSLTVGFYYLGSKANKISKDHVKSLDKLPKAKRSVASKRPVIQRPGTEVKAKKEVKVEPKKVVMPYKQEIISRYQRRLPKTAKVDMKYLGTMTVNKGKAHEIRDLVLISTTFENGKFNSFRASVNPKTQKLENAYGGASTVKKISFDMQHPDA